MNKIMKRLGFATHFLGVGNSISNVTKDKNDDNFVIDIKDILIDMDNEDTIIKCEITKYDAKTNNKLTYNKTYNLKEFIDTLNNKNWTLV
jgi:hypothetical protein